MHGPSGCAGVQARPKARPRGRIARAARRNGSAGPRPGSTVTPKRVRRRSERTRAQGHASADDPSPRHCRRRARRLAMPPAPVVAAGDRRVLFDPLRPSASCLTSARIAQHLVRPKPATTHGRDGAPRSRYAPQPMTVLTCPAPADHQCTSGPRSAPSNAGISRLCAHSDREVAAPRCCASITATATPGRRLKPPQQHDLPVSSSASSMA